MTYRPVIDHVAVPIYLDPLSAVLLAAAFIAAAALTLRRPAYGLGALLIATPFDFSRDVLATTISLPKCVLLGVLLALTAYPAVWRELRRAPAAPIFGALLLYLTATALSAAGAAHLGPVLRETLKWLQYAALFATAFCCYRLDGDDAALLTCAALAAIAVCLSALAQEFAGAPSGLYIGSAIVPRIAGLLEGPNQLSAYCAIAAALLGAWAVVRPAPITALALGLVTCTDLLTFSRAGIAALAIVFALVVLWAGRRAWIGAAAGAARSRCRRRGLRVVGDLRAHARRLAHFARAQCVCRRRRKPGRVVARRLADVSRAPAAGRRRGELRARPPQIRRLRRTNAREQLVLAIACRGRHRAVRRDPWRSSGPRSAHFCAGRFVASLRAQPPWVLAAIAASIALALHQIVNDFVFYPKVGAPWFLLLGIAAAARRSA